MTDAASNSFPFPSLSRLRRDRNAEAEVSRFAEAALERHKQEGLELAVRARWAWLAVIAVMLPFLNPSWDVIFYEGFLVALALVGWLQRRVGRVGLSRPELLLLALDLIIMTIGFLVPNPLSDETRPSAVNYQFGNFIYFFLILAAGTLSYSWRTILAIGNWTAALWLLGAGLVWWVGITMPELTEAAEQAFGHDPNLMTLFDPNAINFDQRVQEMVVFMLVAATLALSVWRFNKLLLSSAALERERTNLSRYFSPNVVEELSRNDEPLKEIRTHSVGVLFVDIVGFTGYAADREPTEVIETLRGFHARMEAAVFEHQGTLDKYLGDGLMATFGTPTAGPSDASEAVAAARAMLESMEEWNAERTAAGEPELCAAFGLHYGPVVLGDIGATQLEFAVIGNTVNIASRLEALARPLCSRLVLSDEMRAEVIAESGRDTPLLDGLVRRDGQQIRGIDRQITVWTIE